MSTASFYDVLRVDPTATVDEIKLAFKRRALQVHPDKGGNKEAFHLVYQALETLSDPEARKRYDSRRAAESSVPDNPRSEVQAKARKAKGHPKAKHAAASTEGNHCQSKAKAGTSPSAMPQSKQTKLLVQLRDLLKQLPRDVRNDVFMQQFSQQQRLILENWMEEQLHPTGPAALRANAQSTPDHDDKSLVRERKQISICLPSREECPAMGATALTRWSGLKAKRKRRKDKKADSRKRFKRAQGRVVGVCNGRGSHYGYRAEIYFDALHVYTGSTEFQTALDFLVVLTFVKQKMQDLTGNNASFEERFQETLSSCAMAHGQDIADMNVRFCVHQSCNFFLGTEAKLRTPVVRSIEQLGQMRRCLEPFRQYSRYMGRHSLYWCYTPAHLQHAWERLQEALAEAFKVVQSDSTRTLQKIRASHEASAHLRARALQYLERHQMVAEDKNCYRPRRCKDRSSRPMEQRERQDMALHDKNQHRPRRLQDPTFAAHKLLSRRLLTLKLLLGRWQRMLTQQQKKDRAQRRRLELLRRKRMQGEERLKRETHKIKRRKYSGFMEDLQWI